LLYDKFLIIEDKLISFQTLNGQLETTIKNLEHENSLIKTKNKELNKGYNKISEEKNKIITE
jgi:hypothetical protein